MALLSSEKVRQFLPKRFISNYLGLRALNDVEMRSLIKTFAERAREGLQSPIKEGKGPLMLRSFVSPPETDPQILEGKMAIGIDIGGTNLRMGVGKIHNGKIEPTSDIKPKEIKIKYASLDNFFQMLLDNGLEKILKENPDIPLACIFSFPGSGDLVTDGVDMILTNELTKEWVIGGSGGKKLGEELNKFLQKKDKKIETIGKGDKQPYGQRKYFIDNDTVALIQNGDDFGIVCASGYNWSMVIEKSKLGESQEQPGIIIINTEAGQAAIAPTIPIITDKLLEIIANEERVPVDEVPLRDEYQVSGKYLGRTLGLVVDELRDEYNLFTSVKSTFFPKSFVVSNILSAEKNHDWEKIMEDFQTDYFSDQEKGLLVQIASALRDRSAQIVADHLIALWQTGCPEKNHLKISSDGPIIQHMPGWKEKFLGEINFITKKQLGVEIRETSYQGKMRDFRGIFDVMSQTIEYFARENK